MICSIFVTDICILKRVNLYLILNTVHNIRSLLLKVVYPFCITYFWFIVIISFVKMLVFSFKKINLSSLKVPTSRFLLLSCRSNAIQSWIVVNCWLFLKWFCFYDRFAFWLRHLNTLFINNLFNMKIWSFLANKIASLIRWVLILIQIRSSENSVDLIDLLKHIHVKLLLVHLIIFLNVNAICIWPKWSRIRFAVDWEFF